MKTRAAHLVAAAQLKLVLSPSHAPALKLALKNAGGAPRQISPVTSTYYDSSDLKLERQRLSLCVREEDGRCFQGLRYFGSVKRADFAGDEWWDPIATEEPDPAAAETGPRLRAIVGNDELHPLFKTHMGRTFYKVCPNSAIEIAAAIGEGQLHAATGAATEPVCQLELELKRGDTAALYDMALGLLDATPLRIETHSLPEQGYQLSGVELEALTPRPLALEPSMTVEAVLLHVTSECLGCLLRNEPLAVSGDAAAFHQMRVALRRFRSVLSAVKAMMPVEQHRWLQGELKWVAGNLGPVRDWDVFATDLLAPVQSALLETVNFKQLAEAATKRRQEVNNTAMEAIGSRRYVELLLKLTCWFASRGWRDQPASEHSAPLFAPIANVAAPLLERRWRQARKRSKHFAKLPQRERHQLRISLKKLRYMTEFLGGLFDDKEVNALMKQLKPLQEDLGHFNDVHTAQRLSKELTNTAKKNNVDVSGQAGLLIGWHLHELANLESKLRRGVRRFRKAKPFRAGRQPALTPSIVDAAT